MLSFNFHSNEKSSSSLITRAKFFIKKDKIKKKKKSKQYFNIVSARVQHTIDARITSFLSFFPPSSLTFILFFLFYHLFLSAKKNVRSVLSIFIRLFFSRYTDLWMNEVSSGGSGLYTCPSLIHYPMMLRAYTFKLPSAQRTLDHSVYIYILYSRRRCIFFLISLRTNICVYIY